ncbi:hypothetical protein ACFE04_021449 [Oxalis oulophora]
MKSKKSQKSEATTKGAESSEPFYKQKGRKRHDESLDADKNLATRVDAPLTSSQLAIENAVNNLDEPVDNLQVVDLGEDYLSHDDMNIDIPQDAAHPSRKGHSSNSSSILIVPIIHDDFLEEPSSIGIEGSSFIGFTTSSPTSISQLSSSCTTALTTTLNIPHELPNMPLYFPMLSLPPLFSLCTIVSSTTLSTLSELPSMLLSLPLLSLSPISSLCEILSSATLNTSSELPSMTLSLPALTSLCTMARLTISENTISSLVSVYLSSSISLIVISTQRLM